MNKQLQLPGGKKQRQIYPAASAQAKANTELSLIKVSALYAARQNHVDEYSGKNFN